MSTLAIVLIVLAALFVILFVGGLVANRRHYGAAPAEYARHVAEADRALEQARAADKGWDRRALEDAAWRALAEERPNDSYDTLLVVLVDDRPGVTEDRAELVAAGPDAEARVVLSRREAGWRAERVH
jgi:hypothetical protein